MTERRSKTGTEVPLSLLPQAIACRIREGGTVVYRIRVVRTRWHHYNVTVRTRLTRKELAPVEVAVFSAAAEKTGPTRRAGRGCAA
ncbi:MAG: hypothetical protein M0Q92_07610 [Methanoregula sp.]|jgi:hypothetical protein|nr:hypothetical protein [Methanoregula sp.]